jgi:hypothetical protein
MKATVKKYSVRCEGMRDLAHILIREDRIMDAVPVLQDCWDKGISGNGAFELMSELMANCNKSQSYQVAWLFEECLPNMHRVAMESMLRKRTRMHTRFFDCKSVNHCNLVIKNRWKNQDKIRKSFVLRP